MNQDDPNQTINDKLCDGTILIGYGKVGHGMNGKDADLDRIGQCLVKSLETIDEVGAANMEVLIHLRLYATVCAPSYEGMNLEAVRTQVSPELRDYFKSMGVDLDRTEDELYDDEESYSKIVEHYQEQAQMIAMDANPCPSDPFAFMWNDGAWEGGIDVTLRVPLTVDEYDAIESDDKQTLDDIAKRICTEIYDANKGGTPERDKIKLFEEQVGLWNDLINKLECYAQPQPTMSA